MRSFRPVKDRYTKYINIAALFLNILSSFVCLFFAVYLILQMKETTYAQYYLSACFPSGEITSSAVLLFCVFITGAVASSRLLSDIYGKIMPFADAVLKLTVSVYFSIFLHMIPNIRYSILAAVLYFSVTAVLAFTVEAK